jgi:hypothetical protein
MLLAIFNARESRRVVSGIRRENIAGSHAPENIYVVDASRACDLDHNLLPLGLLSKASTVAVLALV